MIPESCFLQRGIRLSELTRTHRWSSKGFKNILQRISRCKLAMIRGTCTEARTGVTMTLSSTIGNLKVFQHTGLDAHNSNIPHHGPRPPHSNRGPINAICHGRCGGLGTSLARCERCSSLRGKNNIIHGFWGHRHARVCKDCCSITASLENTARLLWQSWKPLV